MERIDSAKEAFQKIFQFARNHADQIVSETDARFQLIDRILIEVLGWRRDGIRLEPKTDSGYIDYAVYLDREEGSALSSVDPLASVIPPSDVYLMKKSDLGRDMEQLFNEFFKALSLLESRHSSQSNQSTAPNEFDQDHS